MGGRHCLLVPPGEGHGLNANVAETSGRKDESRDTVCGKNHLRSGSFIGVVVVIAFHFHLLPASFAQQQVEWKHRQQCFLTEQANFAQM